MNVLLATRNRHKVREIESILGKGHTYLTLEPLSGVPEVVEDGETFEENAIKKAEVLAEWSRQSTPVIEAEMGCKLSAVLADDSGLEVRALNGEPGVKSARFAATSTSASNASDAANNAKLLRFLAGLAPAERGAQFRCVLAWVDLIDSAKSQLFSGICKGTIGVQPKGVLGFGYDPLFVPAGYSKTFAELGPDAKNHLSHRYQALRQLGEWLAAGRGKSDS